ncbi:EpsG family protein [Leuconostoc citreum]|uniref:EpsG family protein n=1 Tax=Leuconostoc citreum TaxID=33964 RepID=UPI0021820578|nr:EpsG family protein [Leuconostoc citreum]MCS8583061.1 hypothetical protein [Leuconostoc citreum]MCS8601423.1 hypothetical protein [Leuconostoc citreum]
MVVFFFLFITVLVLLSFNDTKTLISIDRQIYIVCVIFLGILIFVTYLFLLSKQNLFQSDMMAYFSNLQNVHYLISFNTLPEVLKQVEFEKGFLILQVIVGYLTNNVQVYALIMYSLILLLPLIAAGFYFGLDSVPFVMIHYVFFNIFNTVSLIVIRQGIAIGILLIALTIYLRGQKKVAIVLMLLAAQYHSTAYIMLIAFLIIKFFRFKLKLIIVLWIIAAISYLTDWNQKIIQLLPFNSQYILSYTGDLWSQQSAMYGQEPNSIKYLFYSMIFLIIILILRRFCSNDKDLLLLVKMYTIWNTLFLMFGFIAFSSRIALYSWFLFPFIVFYVFWKNKLLKTYYPVLLLVWVMVGLVSMPIFGWKAI